MTTAAASFTIAEYIKEVSKRTDGCSFSLNLSHRRMQGRGPFPPLLHCCSASLVTPPRYCSLLAVSHWLLPYGQLQLQLQNRECLANCEILYSDII